MTGPLEVLVNLKYIRRERDGRIYVRRCGRSIRLRETPGTDAFIAEYRYALAATSTPKAHALSAAHGSLSWLCEKYFASGEFKTLSLSTRTVRRRILERICEVDGDKPFARMEPRHVRDLRDEKTGPEAANGVLKALRALFAWAVAQELANTNPAKGVPKIRYKTDGFHTWTIDEVRQYEATHASGTKPRLALALMLYTGARRGDVVLLGRQMIRDGWLTFTASKTGTVVSIPIVPELQTELELAPKENLTILVTAYGRPFTPAGFGIRFREWCNQAGLKNCTAHGLRKAGATIAAERGASEAQLNAIFGWAENSNEVETVYARSTAKSSCSRRREVPLDDRTRNRNCPIDQEWDTKR